MTKRGPRKTSLQFVEPCLATLVNEAPAGENWVHEFKFDGYRLQAHILDGDVRLYTRNGHDWTARFVDVAKALAGLKLSLAIIDGEAIVEDSNGVSSFQMLVSELKAGRSSRIVFVAFDLLHLDGLDIRPLPLRDRKDALKKLLKNARKSKQLRYSDHITGEGAAMLSEVSKLGLEGIISKRIDKPYRSGRHGDWTKAKCLLTDEFVIAGYLDSKSMKNAVGALVASYYRGRDLIYAGRIGTGFSHETARELWGALQPLRIAQPHFKIEPNALQRRGVEWVKPKLVAQIEYRGWTADELLRHAAFKALRDDINAARVRKPKAF